MGAGEEVGQELDMARRIKDAMLDSKDARRKLKARDKPYYRTVERGWHLGYRRLKAQAGTWCVRRYAGDQTYAVEGIGTADDLSDADGVEVLDYWQAVEKIRETRKQRAHDAAGVTGPYTVAKAMDDYIAFLKAEGRAESAIRDAESRDRSDIRPRLGNEEIANLTTKKLKAWRDGLAEAAPRLRTGKGQKQKFRPVATGDDGK